MDASILLSVLRLMLCVSDVSLPSTVSTNSLMVLAKNFSDTRGEAAAMLFMA